MTSRDRIRVVGLRLAFPALFVALLFHVSRAISLAASADEPAVKITSPKENSAYAWNTLVPYSVVVTYQGKSTEYQELPADQVLMTATYVSDLSALTAAPGNMRPPAGLLDIIRSNCLGCHEFTAKAMGPSFAAIAKRYPQSPATISTLSHSIRSGSTGVWGAQSMPPHPEFTEDQAHAIALWIMKIAANPNVSYYVGTEGTIRMKAPGSPGAHAGILLTATYSSPSSSADPKSAPYGEATVILRGK